MFNCNKFVTYLKNYHGKGEWHKALMAQYSSMVGGQVATKLEALMKLIKSSTVSTDHNGMGDAVELLEAAMSALKEENEGSNDLLELLG
jgi:hypothetical protein